jgi:hypothetical protein
MTRTSTEARRTAFFGASSTSFSALRTVTGRLNRSVRKLQREQGFQNPFHPYLFRQMIRVAAELALAEGLLA